MKKFLFLLPFVLAACDTREVAVDPAKGGYDYFPLTAGQYAVYEVESIEYRTGRPADTTHYQVKEVVQEQIVDLSGEDAFKIYRYYRPLEVASWKEEPDSVWTAKRNAYHATRTENNVTFVKLSFPVREELTWNGNALNNQGKLTYKITGAGQPYQLADTTFSSTMTVEQSNDSNLCSKNVQYEVYAKGIGLISKEIEQVYYLQADGECDVNQTISYGRRLTQKLIEFSGGK